MYDPAAAERRGQTMKKVILIARFVAGGLAAQNGTIPPTKSCSTRRCAVTHDSDVLTVAVGNDGIVLLEI